jgi:hypothetical protein
MCHECTTMLCYTLTTYLVAHFPCQIMVEVSSWHLPLSEPHISFPLIITLAALDCWVWLLTFCNIFIYKCLVSVFVISSCLLIYIITSCVEDFILSLLTYWRYLLQISDVQNWSSNRRHTVLTSVTVFIATGSKNFGGWNLKNLYIRHVFCSVILTV